FDRMTLGVDDEGAVVISVILGPEARLAVVRATSLDRCPIERVHRLAAVGLEGDMAAGAGLGFTPPGKRQRYPELRRAPAGAIAEAMPFKQPLVTQRLQRRVIEFARPVEIGGAQRNMIEHYRCSPQS